MKKSQKATSSRWRAMALISACLGALPAMGVDGVWLEGANGPWSSSNNWVGGQIPQSAGDSALLGTYTSQTAVVVDAPFTVGRMDISSPFAYSIFGSGSLTFDNLGQDAILNFLGANHGIANPLTLVSTVDLLAGGTGTATLVSPISGNGNINKSGNGTLVLSGDDSAWPGGVNVTSGILRLSYQPAAGDTIYKGIGTGGISINSGTTLDLNSAARINGFTGDLASPMSLSGSGSAGLGALYISSSPNVVLSGAITISGNTVLRTDATNAATIGFALGDPVTGVGSLGGSGSLTLLKGGSGTGMASFQLNVRSTHTGGTILDGAILNISSLGSLVGTGKITLKSNSELDINSAPGNDPTVAKLSPHSVVLSGGTLVFTVNQDIPSFLASTSGSGQILLQGVQYNGSLDFSQLAAAPRIGATGTQDSSIGANLVLRPDTSGNTLYFGGGSGGARTLTVKSVIADANGVATQVDQSVSESLALPVANTYSGATTIRGGFVKISNSSSLGTASGTDADATTIFSGGELDVGAGLTINERIHLSGGTLNVDPTSVIKGAIVVDASSKLIGGEEKGTISGPGALQIGLKNNAGPLILSGDNTFTGAADISGGKVEARSPTALGSTSAGTTLETSAELYLTTSSGEPVTTKFGSTFHLGATAVYSGSLLMTSGTLTGDAGSILNGDVELLLGTVKGTFSGNATIRKTQWDSATLSNISPNFDGPIRVLQGTLIASLQSLGSTNEATYVSGSAVLQLTGGSSSEAIFLQNANGAGQGALIGGGTINGPLDLGERGSSIGFVSDAAAVLTVNGPISGGSLAVHSDSVLSSLVIGSNANTYTGATVIDTYATLTIGASGSLATTSGITIQPSGTLAIATGGASNRISGVPISLRGGIINVQWTTAEIGDVSIEAGNGIIEVSGPGTVSPGTITMNSIIHQRGGIVRFKSQDGTVDTSDQLGGTQINSGFIRFNSAPALVNGIIGGWAVLANGNFATYGPKGVAPFRNFSTNINTALPTDNVDHFTITGLASSKTINALQMEGSNLNLGGNTLTIETGGISVHSTQSQAIVISNGTLVPGASSDGQLYLIGGIDLSATVADAPGKPTTLVANGITFHGSNTYTGGTYMSGLGNTIASAGALPAGGDLTLSGARVTFNLPNNLQLQVGKLTMQDLYQTSNYFFGNQGTAIVTLSATSYDLRAGYFDIPIAGNGLLTKTGTGTLQFHQSSDQFAGEVDINEGTILTVGGGTGHGAMRIAPGATLMGMGGTINNSSIELNGGTISRVELITGDLHVMGDALIRETTLSGKLTLDRGSTLMADTVHGFVNFNGSAKLDGTLTWVGNNAVSFSNSGGVISGSGSVQANVTISGNSTLAPGDGGGKLTVTGDLAFLRNGKLHINALSGDLGTSLLVNGNVDLSSATDQLELTGGKTGVKYDFLSYTGSLSGVFNVITPGYQVNYDTLNKVVSLVPLPIPGDANDDRIVDFRDFQILEENFGQTGGRSEGDFDGNGIVDRSDLAILFQHYAPLATAPELSLAAEGEVPEPGTLSLLLLGGCIATAGKRWRHRGRFTSSSPAASATNRKDFRNCLPPPPHLCQLRA